MIEIEYTADALADLRHLRMFDQKLVVDRIETQLRAEPTRETRNHKPLRPNDLSRWELRIGDFRVFYDVIGEPATTVKIKAIGWKEHNKLFIRGKEYEL